jgi:hypothetical protein
MSRWIWFILSILIGVAAGLFYGWRINPVKYVNTAPNTLRIDYKTDYVLMIAESYHANGDIALAVQRLGEIGSEPPEEIVRQALLFAERLRYTRSEQAGYTDVDLALLRELSDALQVLTSAVATTQTP